ncbi:uncharacterized protein [Sinocyclocheilus grahami]|uniref:uncharacterized protein n=1 Tax=Sinocyclocheilus grahami TaxID=75366 RepID=UPI0007ACED2C|nr:PREDICTED: uncharacterized protein LOC107548734 [Sinocyclocheilus grahami]
MIESHIQAFDGDAGRDTLGVSLINSARIREILKSQRKHVACIQDPLGVQLYMQTGTVVKGGHHQPTTVPEVPLRLSHFTCTLTNSSQVCWQVTPSSRRIFWMDLQGGMRTGLWQQQLMSNSHIPTIIFCVCVNDYVGPDNIEGYGAVQDLAELLVSLRDHRLALTGEECIKIITLWQALGEYDKNKTIYPPCHQTTLKQGQFRAIKKIVAPGVESTKRCFVGAHSPAQWPDCN